MENDSFVLSEVVIYKGRRMPMNCSWKRSGAASYDEARDSYLSLYSWRMSM